MEAFVHLIPIDTNLLITAIKSKNLDFVKFVLSHDHKLFSSMHPSSLNNTTLEIIHYILIEAEFTQFAALDSFWKAFITMNTFDGMEYNYYRYNNYNHEQYKHTYIIPIMMDKNNEFLDSMYNYLKLKYEDIEILLPYVSERVAKWIESKQIH